ncbi:phosphoglycerate kinase [Candidatus Uhrbacteria bacterium]|nr:phosphoglycerate kinase [Candidatus Uhrbacteria bacterium]
MRLRCLDPKMKFEGKRVLVRIDADVAVSRGSVVEGPSGRLARAAVGLEWLRQRGARIVVLAHRGRPEGKRTPSLSLAPCVKRLHQLLGGGVELSREITGSAVERRVKRLSDGEILVLENVRFLKGETENDKTLAKEWVRLGDLYVNDAFASSHRRHTSVSSLARLLPAYAGLSLCHEVEELSGVLVRPAQPFVCVLGGAKIHTKIGTLRALLRRGADICVGGALAHPFFLAQGFSVGTSRFDPKDVPLAKSLLKKWHKQILLPSDVRVVRVIRRKAPVRTVSPKEVGAKDAIVDMGAETLRRYAAAIASAKTLVWNGPLGVCEIPDFATGTERLAKRMAEKNGRAITIVGGGDTVPLVDRLELETKFTLVSSGGGAMMSFLAGEKMPGLEYLFV